MIRLFDLTPRMWLILAHDLLATAVAVLAAVYLRFGDKGLALRWDLLKFVLPAFVLYSGLVFLVTGMSKTKWRFTSVPDLMTILRAASIQAVTLLVLDYVLLAPNVYGTFFLGKITIALYWFLQMFFLSGTRIAYRYFRYTRTLSRTKAGGALPTLLLGNAAGAEVLLRAIESGAEKQVRPVGILSPSRADRGQAIRGISVLGELDDLERVVTDLGARGTKIMCVVLTPTVLAPEAHPEGILMRARRLGLTTKALPALDDREALQLRPVNVEDLLLRPSVKIDYRRLENFVKGKAAVVTGGGGSIGSEICDRLVAFGLARLLVIENAEPALHAVLESLNAKGTAAKIDGRLADIRDRERMFRLIADFKPDLVFHAAALKHVPLLERDWTEGVRTNVFGSVNVADAAAAAGAAAMVMISTDKAIEPVSVLGATKRVAEMYCQALDADFIARAASRPEMRLIAVRFGNVLASNGSVVPKFKAQIEAGGPVTVTHPDMVRYFMTIREACDLVITAASHALGPQSSDVAVYVLNMGQPVKIVGLAERIIKLSGLEPGTDIEIKFTGVRPGERMNEILFARDEPITQIGIDGIVAARPLRPSLESLRGLLRELEDGVARGERGTMDRILHSVVPHAPVPSPAKAGDPVLTK
ncbi:MAG: polysaccharide biosynthesis protein [Xanthobacteraceae bacterium]|nr:polysaccharide biosynthesis protein [Xanthobacteraceae bacterium]